MKKSPRSSTTTTTTATTTPAVTTAPGHTPEGSDVAHDILLADSAPRGEAAFHRVKSRLLALDPDKVRALSAEPTLVVTTVLGASHDIQKLRPRIVHELPTVDLTQIDSLEDYALAFFYAQGRYLAAITPPDQVPALTEKLTRERTSALIAADGLVDAGIFPAGKVADIREGKGTRDAASDAVTLASLFEERAEAVRNKTHFGPDRVRELRSLGERVLMAISWREHNVFDIGEAMETRDRAFTLVNNAYSMARHVVGYLRAEQGDADTIAPSFHTNGGGHSHTEEPAKASDGTGGSTPAAGSSAAGEASAATMAGHGASAQQVHAATPEGGAEGTMATTTTPARVTSPFVDE